jgi:hypothetical protein
MSGSTWIRGEGIDELVYEIYVKDIGKMDRGYTLVWRKVWDNPVLKERGKRFSRLEAWLYLVNVAARGSDDPGTGLRRGEFEASVRHLAKIWLGSISTVFAFLRDLEQNQMVKHSERSAERCPERFIICNYETYNPTRNAGPNAKPNAQPNNIKERLKEGKKKEKENSIAADAATVDPPPSAEAVRLSELLRSRIALRDGNAKAAKLPVPPGWARDIDKLLRIDGRKPEDCEAVIVWCQSKGCFWGPNILSGKKLREKFDTMWGQMRRPAQKTNFDLHLHNLEVGKRFVERGQIEQQSTG